MKLIQPPRAGRKQRQTLGDLCVLCGERLFRKAYTSCTADKHGLNRPERGKQREMLSNLCVLCGKKTLFKGVIHLLDLRSSVSGIFKRYGMRNMFKTWGRTLRMYVREPSYRAFMRQIQERGVMPENIFEYLGYGLYVGRKSVEEAG